MGAGCSEVLLESPLGKSVTTQIYLFYDFGFLCIEFPQSKAHPYIEFPHSRAFVLGQWLEGFLPQLASLL